MATLRENRYPDAYEPPRDSVLNTESRSGHTVKQGLLTLVALLSRDWLAACGPVGRSCEARCQHIIIQTLVVAVLA